MHSVTESRYNKSIPSNPLTHEGDNSAVSPPRVNINQQRGHRYDHLQYNELNTSADILNSIFKDMYGNGLPSPLLSPMMSSYASMRLGVYSDSTNAVPVVHTGDDDFQALDGGYFVRGGQQVLKRTPYPASPGNLSTEYQRVGGSNTWITALTWGSREAGMLPLAPGSKSYITEVAKTVDYLMVLAHEWSTYNPALPQDIRNSSHYVRTGSDAIFRVTTHKASSIVSRPLDMQMIHGYPLPGPILNDNVLHVAAIWDVDVSKWLLLGIFLCPEGLAISDTWSRSPKSADRVYTMSLSQKISSEKKIYVKPLPDIVITEPISTPVSSVGSLSEGNKAEGEIPLQGSTRLRKVDEKIEESVGPNEEPHVGSESDDEDDDYWAQYDDLAGSDEEADEKSENQKDPSNAVISNTRKTSQNHELTESENEEESYYNKYDKVEPMIHGDDVDRTKVTNSKPAIPSGTEVSESSYDINRCTSPVWPGAFPSNSPIATSSTFETPPSVPRLNEQEFSSGSATKNTESFRFKSIQSSSLDNSVLKAHVSESIASLYKLSRSQGMSVTDFMTLASEATASVKD